MSSDGKKRSILITASSVEQFQELAAIADRMPELMRDRVTKVESGFGGTEITYSWDYRTPSQVNLPSNPTLIERTDDHFRIRYDDSYVVLLPRWNSDKTQELQYELWFSCKLVVRSYKPNIANPKVSDQPIDPNINFEKEGKVDDSHSSNEKRG